MKKIRILFGVIFGVATASAIVTGQMAKTEADPIKKNKLQNVSGLSILLLTLSGGLFIGTYVKEIKAVAA